MEDVETQRGEESAHRPLERGRKLLIFGHIIIAVVISCFVLIQTWDATEWFLTYGLSVPLMVGTLGIFHLGGDSWSVLREEFIPELITRHPYSEYTIRQYSKVVRMRRVFMEVGGLLAIFPCQLLWSVMGPIIWMLFQYTRAKHSLLFIAALPIVYLLLAAIIAVLLEVFYTGRLSPELQEIVGEEEAWKQSRQQQESSEEQPAEIE